MGTVGIVVLLRDSLNLSLADAKALIDRCVFDRETVSLQLASLDTAHTLADRIRGLASPAVFHVQVEA